MQRRNETKDDGFERSLMNIILASNNAGKIAEFSALLAPLDYHITPQKEFNIVDVAETGLTFIENALQKARNAATLTGLPALADDSGLVVPALNGAPGIYSARYAGEKANAQMNINKLLADMTDFQQEQRRAWFYCVLVFLRHANDPSPIIAQGSWHGEILMAPRGAQGFGYDPIFWLADLQKSSAELPLELKNALSHRGKALQSLIAQLR